MDQLGPFLERFGRRRNARHWLGPRPDVRTKALPRAIAAMIGYPTSQDGWPDKEELRQIELGKAAELLAFVATKSLAYGGFGPPRESYRKSAAAALGDLESGAVFLTNTADWVSGGPVGWSVHLTNATLEAGLIAYDAQQAMIYWVEEEA